MFVRLAIWQKRGVFKADSPEYMWHGVARVAFKPSQVKKHLHTEYDFTGLDQGLPLVHKDCTSSG
jgi:hypothetical protein